MRIGNTQPTYMYAPTYKAPYIMYLYRIFAYIYVSHVTNLSSTQLPNCAVSFWGDGKALRYISKARMGILREERSLLPAY